MSHTRASSSGVRSVLALAVLLGFPLIGAGAGCLSASEGDFTSDAGQGRGDAHRSEAGGSDGAEGGGDSAGGDAGRERPSLTALSVTSTPGSEAGPAVALSPAFSPTIHDYYVRCAEGDNALTVSMTAALGSSSVLFRPVASASLPAQTVSLIAREDDAIVAAATNGAATVEYWVRCLPHDMPLLTWDLHPEAGAPTPGYYLLGNMEPARGEPGYAMVIDPHGVPVWYARAPKAQYGVYNVTDVIDGAVTFLATNAAKLGAPSSYEVHQLRPLMTTQLAPAGYPTNVHEFQKLPNGDYVVFSLQTKLGVDLSGLSVGLPGGKTEKLGPDMGIQDCAIVEFTPGGSVVRTWYATDHFEPRLDSTFPQLSFAGATAPDGGPLIDVFHCNSMDIDPANGNLLVSSRHMDSVFYLEWPSGIVLWKMGGRSASKDNAAYVSVADPFFRQHDARLQPGWSASCNGGSGQISMYDDQTNRAADARAVVYDVVVGGPAAGACDAGAPEGGAPGTATVAWQVTAPSNSASSGSFRIMADGSRVIDWGFPYKAPGLVFSEVDLAGNRLLDLRFSDAQESYRTVKVPLSRFELDDLRAAAGLP